LHRGCRIKTSESIGDFAIVLMGWKRSVGGDLGSY
jgi:hypothetical protein